MHATSNVSALVAVGGWTFRIPRVHQGYISEDQDHPQDGWSWDPTEGTRMKMYVAGLISPRWNESPCPPAPRSQYLTLTSVFNHLHHTLQNLPIDDFPVHIPHLVRSAPAARRY